MAVEGLPLASPSLFLPELAVNLLLKNLQTEDLKGGWEHELILCFEILTYGCYHLT